MDLIIHGGKKLHGTIKNQSAKNSAVAILCASILVKNKVSLVDVPRIEEVNRIIELLQSIGVKVKRKDARRLVIDSSGELDLNHINKDATEKTRASLFLWGVLASRVKSYSMPKSGGCHLGERTVRPHCYALEKLGVHVASRASFYEVNNDQLHGADIVMYESGDTTTENTIMAAVLAPGRTTIKMASANYMVQDLCYFLQKAGAKIRGIGSTTLVIEGVKKLCPVQDYPIMPDPIIAMTFISAGITTGSHVTVTNCPLEFLELELAKLETMGQKLAVTNQRKSKNGKFEVADIEIFPGKLTALPDKIYGRPFPGLNIDNLPLFVPILTQAEGRALVLDWAYENRAVSYLELQKLGANITLLDSLRVWVEGRSELKANELDSPKALRVAAATLICMLAAKGRSVLRGTYMIDRGYENLYDTLNRAGAEIEVIK